MAESKKEIWDSLSYFFYSVNEIETKKDILTSDFIHTFICPFFIEHQLCVRNYTYEAE